MQAFVHMRLTECGANCEKFAASIHSVPQPKQLPVEIRCRGRRRLRAMRGAVPQLTTKPRHIDARKRAFAVRDIAQNMSEPTRGNRLVDIAERAGAYRVDRTVLVRLRRDEHDLHVWSLAREHVGDLVAPPLRHLDVEQRQVGMGFQDPVESIGAVRRLAQDIKAGL